MALGDGSGWDETVPTDATDATQIDDYDRDLRKGISGRLAHEHEFPASQSATSAGGKHKFVTLQAQGTKPTVSGTQVGAVYAKTDNNLYYENSAGTEITIVSGTAVGDGKVLANSTDAAAGYLGNKIDSSFLVISGTNLTLSTTALKTYRYTSNSASTQLSTPALILCFGQAATVTANGSVAITNLPFADTTAYSVTVVSEKNDAASGDGGIRAVKNSGAQFTIYNPEDSNWNVNWIAIGV